MTNSCLMGFLNYLQTRTFYSLNAEIMSSVRLKVEVKRVCFLGELMLPTLVLLFPLLSENLYCYPPLGAIFIVRYLCSSWSAWTLRSWWHLFYSVKPHQAFISVPGNCSPTKPFTIEGIMLGGKLRLPVTLGF